MTLRTDPARGPRGRPAGLALASAVALAALAVSCGEDDGSATGTPSPAATSPAAPTASASPGSPGSPEGSFVGTANASGFYARVVPAGADRYQVIWTEQEARGTDPAGCAHEYGPDVPAASVVVSGAGPRYEGQILSLALTGGKCFYGVQAGSIEVGAAGESLQMCFPDAERCLPYTRAAG
ncbi:hypothetical protein ACWGB8_20065 [Kitasatospora sp. NPDC054939]